MLCCVMCDAGDVFNMHKKSNFGEQQCYDGQPQNIQTPECVMVGIGMNGGSLTCQCLSWWVVSMSQSFG